MESYRFDARFKAGASHLVVGPSASGKTYRVANLLRSKSVLIEGGDNIRNVIWCYATWQPIYDDLKMEGVVTKWVNKKPSNKEFVDLVKKEAKCGGSIVVIDDFMSEIDKDMVDIVCVSSRHHNCSTFFLFQSLFPANKLARQISLNVKYIHIHKNPRENEQIRYMARQLRPSSYKWIVDAYHEATSLPHSCFLIDLMQTTPEDLRFRSCYLPGEGPMRVWNEK